VRYLGGTVVFADVRPDTLNLDPAKVEACITPRTRAIITVDYAGQPSDLDELDAVGARQALPLIADASHALGATYRGRPVGGLARMTTFSLHPVKHITTGEGGLVTTDDPTLASRLRIFRNHGITREHQRREDWRYEIVELGYNYRLSDIQAALGLSQLDRLADRIARRREIATQYARAFAARFNRAKNVQQVSVVALFSRWNSVRSEPTEICCRLLAARCRFASFVRVQAIAPALITERRICNYVIESPNRVAVSKERIGKRVSLS